MGGKKETRTCFGGAAALSVAKTLSGTKGKQKKT